MRLMKNISNAARDENGSLSIEALFWFVTLCLIGTLMLDGSAIFYQQTQIMRVMQDADRAYSMNSLKTTDEHKAYIIGRIKPVSSNVKVDNAVINNILVTQVSVPAGDLAITGMFGPLNRISLGFTAKHVVEDWGT